MKRTLSILLTLLLIISVMPLSAFAVSLVDVNRTVTPLGDTRYKVTITVDANDDLTDVEVVDVVPSSFIASATDGGAAFTANTFTGTKPTMANGSQEVFEYYIRLNTNVSWGGKNMQTNTTGSCVKVGGSPVVSLPSYTVNAHHSLPPTVKALRVYPGDTIDLRDLFVPSTLITGTQNTAVEVIYTVYDGASELLTYTIAPGNDYTSGVYAGTTVYTVDSFSDVEFTIVCTIKVVGGTQFDKSDNSATATVYVYKPVFTNLKFTGTNSKAPKNEPNVNIAPRVTMSGENAYSWGNSLGETKHTGPTISVSHKLAKVAGDGSLSSGGLLFSTGEQNPSFNIDDVFVRINGDDYALDPTDYTTVNAPDISTGSINPLFTLALFDGYPVDTHKKVAVDPNGGSLTTDTTNGYIVSEKSGGTWGVETIRGLNETYSNPFKFIYTEFTKMPLEDPVKPGNIFLYWKRVDNGSYNASDPNNDFDRTYVAQWDVDELGHTPVTDPTFPGSDGVADKYQRFGIYKVAGGSWNDNTSGDKYEVANMTNGGAFSENNEDDVRFTTPAVGSKPAAGYRASGSWSPMAPAAYTNIKDIPLNANNIKAATFTYTYDKEYVIVDPNGGSWTTGLANGADTYLMPVDAWVSDGTGSASETYTTPVKFWNKTGATPENPSMAGYNFSGWTTETNTAYDPADPLKNWTTKYTANYTTVPVPPAPVNYSLTYESNGGTSYPSESYPQGTLVTLDKNPVRTSYSFTGWYSDPACTNRVTKVTMSGDKTVYAGWRVTEVPQMLDSTNHIAYIVGYPDGGVHPEATITRAETASVFFRLLKDEVRDGALTNDCTFLDVAENCWYRTEVATMAKLGIIEGRSPEVFDGNAPITRAEFAVIAARFANGSSDDQHFSDVIGHWAEKQINYAASVGWIEGYEDGTFHPQDLIKRCEAITLINRVLKRVPESESDMLPNMIRWWDNPASKWYYLPMQEATNSHDAVFKDEVHERWTKFIDPIDWDNAY